ncbi:enoyl-CoA hydratase [Rhodobacteraceae bacterium RKSG542]|uniref:enoyl-CoA hydratase-related protein n=1 Tax=Pseudovibrio flavus TaxID=2529854 RepID=UPI0012BD497E|nr:enoyl-CoA hydratase-related protein [Pseudovibrio flavus]MTI18743.1 enoyl-CoA hydratase [Pseudovibrio flavus]
MISLEVKDGVQIVRIDRAEKKNALTFDMYETLAEAFIVDKEDVGCTLVLGQPEMFTAGNDIGDFLKFASGSDMPMGGVVKFLSSLTEIKTPMVVGVDGPAIGVGTTMLLHADMVVASPRASFKTPFVNLGLVPEAGSSFIAPQIMGHARAFELLVLGETFTAQRAYEAGLVNKIVPEEALENEAFELAKKIAAMPREAVRLSKGLLDKNKAAIGERISDEMDIFKDRLKSAEARNAFMAFMMKSKK